MKTITIRLFTAVMGACLVATGPAVADVRDNAGMFSPQAIQDANNHIEAIKEKRKKDLIIETFETVPDGKSTEVERMNAKTRSEFFAKWANKRAAELELDGVYVLICKKPSHINASAGVETKKKAFTQADCNELRDVMVGRFNAKEFDRGLREGVTFVRNSMKGNVKHGVNPDQQPVGGGLDLKGWLCTAIVVLGIVWVVIAVVRAFSRSGQGAAGAAGSPGFGGGGLMTGLLGGLFGAMAGNWLYHNMFGGGGGWGGSSAHADEPGASDTGASDEGRDFSGAGGDFGDTGGDTGGSWGGGGDWGGGDFGGGGGDY